MRITTILSFLVAGIATANSMATTGDRNLARGFIEARCHCDGTCCNGYWCTDDDVGQCCNDVPC
ncbi:hypothetical protein GQ607_016770 [Colletotrichum asianum]|uniref:Uncharacterized protein n=1 Tax=Colletotrichum asianum TaxID=702518 RepID=A0A8H3VYV0_9PEZI|nr:hypothetical protein GQ607_016770 [Colletotrichum asianum]